MKEAMEMALNLLDRASNPDVPHRDQLLDELNDCVMADQFTHEEQEVIAGRVMEQLEREKDDWAHESLFNLLSTLDMNGVCRPAIIDWVAAHLCDIPRASLSYAIPIVADSDRLDKLDLLHPLRMHPNPSVGAEVEQALRDSSAPQSKGE